MRRTIRRRRRAGSVAHAILIGTFAPIFMGIFLLQAERGAATDGPPFEPEDALGTFELADGFQIEVFAAEPLVLDPVDMTVDENGRIYVVEMPGYPLDTSGSGRVALLADTNGDGYPDMRTVFASGLTLPTGILRWRDGILVSDAPDLLYFVDETGDGRADRREVILTGFARSNPQHNFNAPRYGLDNGIYLANNSIIRTQAFAEQFGDPGAPVRFADREDGPVLSQNAGGRNVRFRIESGELEELSGWSQFGHTFDAFGRHFLVSNAHHQFHEVVAARYLSRNPALPVREAVAFTPEHGNAADVYPITISPEHQLLTDRGVFTSASGLTYYLGGAFPAPYDRATFVAESVHNLVHVDLVEESGATFVARRLIEGREFLASTDGWFRPVNFYVGPDGALYLLDYYRRIVEHPEWMDQAAIEAGELYEGADRGRIFRITPTGAAAPDWVDRIRLGDLAPAELVEHLSSENVWWRMQAQRLLVDRGAAGVVEGLAATARRGHTPEARLHALWTLEGAGMLTDELVASALRDPEPGVREHAVRLAEKRGTSEFLTALLGLAEDPHPRVRFQLLLTLGDLGTDDVAQARRAMLIRDLEDEWFQIAALTAGTPPDAAYLASTMSDVPDAPGGDRYVRRVASLVAAAGPAQDLAAALDLVLAPGSRWRSAVLEGLAEGLRRRAGPAPDLADAVSELVDVIFSDDDSGVRAAALDVLGSVDAPLVAAHAARAAREARESTDAARRAEMIALIEIAGPGPYAEDLRRIIEERPDPAVEAVAVRTLGRIPGEEISRFLLERWPVLSARARNEALDAMLRERGRALQLLDEVEQGRIAPAALGWNRRVRLMRDWEGDVRDRARALLRESDATRAEVVLRYQAALEIEGDASRGWAVYARSCAQCHAVRGQGPDFGPDLATVAHWSPRALLVAILDPDQAIADGYELWRVERRGGEALSGVLRAETSTAVTLVLEGGREVVLARDEIESMALVGRSGMPDELEEQISVQQMADLLAFMRQAE